MQAKVCIKKTQKQRKVNNIQKSVAIMTDKCIIMHYIQGDCIKKKNLRL